MKTYKVFTLIEAENLSDLETKLDREVRKELQEEGTVSTLFQVSKY